MSIFDKIIDYYRPSVYLVDNVPCRMNNFYVYDNFFDIYIGTDNPFSLRMADDYKFYSRSLKRIIYILLGNYWNEENNYVMVEGDVWNRLMISKSKNPLQTDNNLTEDLSLLNKNNFDALNFVIEMALQDKGEVCLYFDVISLIIRLKGINLDIIYTNTNENGFKPDDLEKIVNTEGMYLWQQ